MMEHACNFWSKWKHVELGTDKSVSTLSWAPDVLQRLQFCYPKFIFFNAFKYNFQILIY